MTPRSLPRVALMGVLAVAASTACSSPPDDEVVNEEAQDLTSSYVFHCRAAYRASGPEIATIRVSKTRATLGAVGPSLAGVAGFYTYNPNYHPRAASHQGYSQYGLDDGQGHKMVLLFDGTMRTGGVALPSGGHGGDVTLEGPRISHGLESMYCRR